MRVLSGPAVCFVVTIAVCTLQYVDAQADGNPHHWDRMRRCDQTDYDPPCGACEGYGGIPTGDENDEITLTTCSVVNNASGVDPSTLIKPKWGAKFVTTNYNEVLIGPKVDPFCFQVAPSNQSTGKLCYQRDGGMQTYDMTPGGPKALRDDLVLDSTVGKIQSTVIAQGLNLWIVNKFPWYAAGTHQCICTNVHQGSDPTSPFLYPIQYNWTQQMYYVGREKIGVESFDVNIPNTERVLDHWAYGPHHVWSEPDTGRSVRMWQPYNGLEVFPDGTNNATGFDPTKFDDLPPTLCKKGGATFRIGCTDGGLPQPKEAAHSAAIQQKLKEFPKNTNTNIGRAEQVVPSAAYKGENFYNMSHNLNKWLTTSAKVRMCDTFTSEELQDLSATLYLARDVDLDQVYQGANDNRRLRGDLKDLQQKWASLNNLIEGNEDSEEMKAIQRDGHCHEAVMWYVHHLSEDVKKVLGETGVEIPLLSYNAHTGGCREPRHSTHAKICAHYQETVTCADCHSDASPPKNTA
jgi:hypothetical protein